MYVYSSLKLKPPGKKKVVTLFSILPCFTYWHSQFSAVEGASGKNVILFEFTTGYMYVCTWYLLLVLLLLPVQVLMLCTSTSTTGSTVVV